MFVREHHRLDKVGPLWDYTGHMRTPTKTQPGDCIYERRSRQTGTTVIVEYLPWIDEAQPWQTTCVDHGGVCAHETRSLALSFASVPGEWCEECMAALEEN